MSETGFESAAPLGAAQHGSDSRLRAGSELLRIVRINEEIKAVVTIAFRINIMALNAIFLAKRAGRVALGFSVLSNELRVFARDLRELMTRLSAIIAQAVGQVSVLLKQVRVIAAMRKAADACRGEFCAFVTARVDAKEEGLAKDQQAFRDMQRSLELAIEDAARLVALGAVLASSARIEAAYGGTFASELTQVSNEFAKTVEEVRISLDALKKYRFTGK